jgi:ADP-heptose:LPS heptosyltransferase
VRAERPDALISTWISSLAGPVAFLSGAKERVGWIPAWSRTMRAASALWSKRVRYDPPPRGRDVGRYDSETFARMLGVSPLRNHWPILADPLWPGPSLRAAEAHMARLERPILGVNAVARSYMRQRQYPIRQMAAALHGLLEQGVVRSIVFFGDADSREEIRPLVEMAGSRCLDLSGELRLSNTAAAMDDCDALLVVDGGLLHVALTTDLPIVALYGPTEIFSTDPRGERGAYAVLSAFDRCTCRARNHRGIDARDVCRNESRCLASISPERIVGEVAAILELREHDGHPTRDAEALLWV